jgi:integrase
LWANIAPVSVFEGATMTKRHKPLTDKEVQAAKPGTNMRDGGGLFLRVTSKGGKSWVFRFTSPAGDMAGKGREMGLGSYPAVSLSDARDAATIARAMVIAGKDPIAEQAAKKAENVEGSAAKAAALTLGEYADKDFLPDLLKGFDNSAHRQQWVATFTTHFAKLRPKKLADVTKKDVLDVIKPLWAEKYETASRSLGRLERLFDHAAQNFAFEGENPALFRHFNTILIRPKTMKKGHHAAIAHEDIAPFIAALQTRQGDSLTALMVEFIARAACRSGEARFAVWSEIDFDKGLWSIPKERMKAKKGHVVPLTPRMVEILQEAKARNPVSLVGEAVRPTDFVFVTARGKPLSEMAGLMMMRRMKEYEAFTIHGLRATFKSWAMAETEFPRELIEEALAHSLNAVEAAYARVSAVERRRALMLAWETHLNGQSPAGATVLPFKGAAAQS